jgi:hypothetical protein
MKILRAVAIVAILALFAVAPGVRAQEADGSQMKASSTRSTFPLFVSPGFLSCVSGSSKSPPTATVTLVKGKLNDTLTIKLRHFKSKLAFDLFTVQNSNLDSTGALNGSFVNFGLAWYQSDIEVNSAGNATVKIQTILVNQIFGFDPAATLAPTNTFHVGFWFDNPNDATACGFAGPPTPFNGTHNAGPVAFISVPDATSTLGPLCLSPSSTPGVCNP